ncbi:ABC transporter permease subunit [Leucobacter rhizosphaerae]|uniref:ABC transporter permease subunit n=1 Tax=Leucobacter rhizosphaerae TaxID=2932245 RepID=A0ABY4FS94_9MICO|nr:ABC transporter permease subunit [Leucobacter rhizosphaerae]UOQ59180.1 ABC transporter permease subunit [Leucobacter rhizosphaerae]
MTLSTTGIPTVRPPKRSLFDAARLPKIALALAAAGFFIIFFFWPLLDVVLRSISVDGVMDWANPQFTLENYLTILQDEYLHLVEWRTVVLAVNSTVLALLLGFPTAYFISRLPARVAGVVLLLILIPFQVSIVVRLFAVTSILSPNGLLSEASQALGGEKFSLLYTQGGTLLGTVMYLLPYMILILYSGMTSIDHNVILAARTLGASGVQIFFKVFLPLVRTSILSGTLLCFILALSFFIVPAILGGPQEQTVAVYIQQQIDLFQWGVASALGVVLLLATLILYVAVLRIGGGFQAPGMGASQAKGVSQDQRFSWSGGTIVTGALTLVSLLVLLVPVLIVFPLSVGETQTVVFPPRGFTLEWYGEVVTTTTWLDPIVRSLLVATLTGLASTALALYLARVVQTAKSERTKLIISGLAFAPIITPAILLAIGIYAVELRLKLAGTIPGLVFAHTLVSFPLAFAILNTSLASRGLDLETAAWTMGASRISAFWKVTVRGMIPAILSAFGLAFVTSWDEVVLALFLQTGPVKTLPVTIYQYLESGIVPTVPAIAALLTLLVIAVIIIQRIMQSRKTAAAKNTK